MEPKHEDDLDPVDTNLPDDQRAPEAAEPEDSDDPGFGGGGGPAAIIYGEDDEADEHGDRLARGPDDGR